ncbi:MAG: hypothetical protein MSB12_02830 [Lentisphaeraceae bacterium]|nr:hypothetical protein [Lentisphaeraceae bacterium]
MRDGKPRDQRLGRNLQRQRAERAEITLAERERFAKHARAEQQATLQASLKALREQFTTWHARHTLRGGVCRISP